MRINPIPPDLQAEMKKGRLHKEAYQHIAKCKAMIELLENNADFAITVKVSDLKIGLCNNETFIAALQADIVEAQNCLKGIPNRFE